MTDQERDLRAHLRAAQLPPAPPTLHMALHRVTDGAPPRRSATRRTIVLLAAAALLLLGGGAIGAGGILNGRPDDARTAPVWSPNVAVTVPSPDAQVQLPGPGSSCPTETARILTGGAMPPVKTQVGTVAPGSAIRGSYVIDWQEGSTVPAELWAVQDGAFRRIAVITGSMNVVWVSDVSRDGNWILVTLGRLSPSGANPECTDLYAIASDGSTVTQLTHNGAGQLALDGKFSSDGRFVAFNQTSGMPATGPWESRLVVWDSASGTSLEHSCEYRAPVAWAPDDGRVASLCGGAVLVVDAATGETGATPSQVTSPWAVGWTGPASIIVATDSAAVAPELTVTQLALADNSLSGVFGAPTTVALSDEPVSGTLAVQAGSGGLLVQVDSGPAGVPRSETWGYGLDLAAPGASPVQVAETGVIDAQWSAAADAFVVHSIVAGVHQVDLHDAETGTTKSLATIPLGAQSVIVRAVADR